MHHALAILTTATALLSLTLDRQALLRSQSCPHAGAWLTAIPGEPATTLPPPVIQVGLRRRLRLPLPITARRCGSPGCGNVDAYDAYGNHSLACPRTGLLARRAKVVERAWVRVAREAVGPEGHVVPQQWLVTGPNDGNRRQLDLIVHGACPLGLALCCDATLVSPLTHTNLPQR